MSVIYVVHGATLNLYTFSDGCAWRPLLVLQSDLLQRHKVVRQLTPPLEDRSVRALEERREGGEEKSRKLDLCGTVGLTGVKSELHNCVSVSYNR